MSTGIEWESKPRFDHVYLVKPYADAQWLVNIEVEIFLLKALHSFSYNIHNYCLKYAY